MVSSSRRPQLVVQTSSTLQHALSRIPDAFLRLQLRCCCTIVDELLLRHPNDLIKSTAPDDFSTPINSRQSCRNLFSGRRRPRRPLPTSLECSRIYLPNDSSECNEIDGVSSTLPPLHIGIHVNNQLERFQHPQWLSLRLILLSSLPLQFGYILIIQPSLKVV